MKCIHKLSFCFLGFIILFLNSNIQAQVCRLEYIANTENLYKEAEFVLPKDKASKLEDIEIYITYKYDGDQAYLYFHSNYITPGAKHPTKVFFENETINDDLYTVISNIVFSGRPSFQDLNKLDDAISSMKIHLDVKILENTELMKLDLSQTPNIQLYKKSFFAPIKTHTPSYLELLEVQERLIHKASSSEHRFISGEFKQILTELRKENINRIKSINNVAEQFEQASGKYTYTKVLEAFQTKNGINKTGKFDHATITKLEELEEAISADFSMMGHNPGYSSELNKVISDYQLNKGLDVTGIYNKNTSDALKAEMNQLKKQLESHIEGIKDLPLSNQILEYNKIIGIDQWEASIGSKFTTTLNNERNYFLKFNDKYVPFEQSNVSVKSSVGEELKKLNTIRYQEGSNLHIEQVEDIKKTIQLLDKRLDWKYNTAEIKILPLTKNKDTRNLLENQFSKNWIKPNLNSEEKLLKKLKKYKGQTVMVVGHIENGKYIEGSFSIDLKRLNEFAKNNQMNIFHLGCSSAKHLNTGTTASINTYQTINALIPTIKENNNFKQFFIAFSSKKIGPNKDVVNLIIDANTFKNQGYSQIKMYQKATAGTATLGGGVLLYYVVTKD